MTVDVDVIYGHKAGMALTFDVYHPHDGNGAAVLFINSGAFWSPVWGTQHEAIGSTGYRFIHRNALPVPEDRQASFEDLLANGFTVFDVRHGSSPKFVLPEIVEDVRLAVRYVRAHATDFRIDADRIGVWGASAGGYLAVMLGTSGDEGYPAPDSAVDRVNSRADAVVAYYPVGYDWVSLVKRFPDDAAGNPAYHVDEDVLESLGIRNHISAGNAPTLIICGEEDFAAQDVDSMYSAFQRHGVVSRLITIPGTGHEFRLGDVYHPQHAERAMAELLAWFQQHLLNE